MAGTKTTRRRRTKAAARVPADTPSMTVSTSIPPEYMDAGVTVEEGSGVLLIPLALVLEAPYQPRSAASLKEDGDLRSSIEANGQTVPAEVRPVYIQEGKATDKTHQRLRFELIYGHRRFRVLSALQDRGFLRSTIRHATDAEAARLVLAENQARRDLTPMEIARAAERLEKDGLIQEEIGKILGRSQPNVANMLRVVRGIPKDVLAKVDDGLVTFTSLRPLLPFTAADGHQHLEDIRRLVERAIPYTIRIRDRHEPAVSEERMIDEVRGRLGGWFTNIAGKPKMARWRPLDAKAARVYDRSNPSARQRPTMAEYLKRAPGKVHDFGPLGKWACNADAWKHAADAEARKRDGKTEKAPAEEAGPDPVLQKAGLQARRLQIRIQNLAVSARRDADPEYVEAAGKPVDLRAAHTVSGYAVGEIVGPKVRDGINVGDTAYRAAISGDSMYAPNGKRVILLIDDFRPDMADHAECTRDCVKGRMIGIISGGKDPNGRTVRLCTNPVCLVDKLAAGRAEREAAVLVAATEEERTVASARGRFPTLSRGAALMLLAVLTEIATVPTGEDSGQGVYGRGHRIRAIEVLRNQLGDDNAGAITTDKESFRYREQLTLHPAELAQVLAATSVEDLSRMVYDLAIGAVRDEDWGEKYQVRAGLFADLVVTPDEEAAFEAAGEAAVGSTEEADALEAAAEATVTDPGEPLMASAIRDGGECPICALKYGQHRTYKAGQGMRTHLRRQHPQAWERFEAAEAVQMDGEFATALGSAKAQRDRPLAEVLDRVTDTIAAVEADAAEARGENSDAEVEASHEEMANPYPNLPPAVIEEIEAAMAEGREEMANVKADVLKRIAASGLKGETRDGMIADLDALTAGLAGDVPDGPGITVPHEGGAVQDDVEGEPPDDVSDPGSQADEASVLEAIADVLDPEKAQESGDPICPVCGGGPFSIRGMVTHIRRTHGGTWELYKASRS